MTDPRKQALLDLAKKHAELCDLLIRMTQTHREFERELADIAVTQRQMIGRLGFFDR